MPSNPYKPFANAVTVFRNKIIPALKNGEVEYIEIYYQLRQLEISDTEAIRLIDDHITLGYIRKDGGFLVAEK